MSYEIHDASVQDGDPVHLFLFVYEGTEYRFTDVAVDYTALGETWESAGLSAGKINQSNDLTKDVVSTAFPLSSAFAQLFLANIQNTQTTLTIFRGYRADPDEEFATYWKGRVAESSAGRNTITLNCEPIFTSLRRPGLRARYQRNCRHAHYGRGCNLNPEDFAVDAVVTAVDGTVVTVPVAASQPDGHYTAGMIRAADQVLRFIADHVGDQLTISHPHAALSELAGYGNSYGKFYGAGVKIYPGCNRSSVVCLDDFDNLDNYGGFSYIPTRNPFGGSSIV